MSVPLPTDVLPLAKAVDAVTKGIDSFAFNKAIAVLYGFTNTLAKASG